VNFTSRPPPALRIARVSRELCGSLRGAGRGRARALLRKILVRPLLVVLELGAARDALDRAAEALGDPQGLDVVHVVHEDVAVLRPEPRVELVPPDGPRLAPLAVAALRPQLEAVQDLGFGRTVVLETEVPNMLAD
jgi:hypothetical protein